MINGHGRTISKLIPPDVKKHAGELDIMLFAPEEPS